MVCESPCLVGLHFATMRMGGERKKFLDSSLEWNLKCVLLVLYALIIIYTVVYTGGKVHILCLVSNKT